MLSRSFKLLAGTFTDYSWPDDAGSWIGMDGVEYDVTISTRSDTVRLPGFCRPLPLCRLDVVVVVVVADFCVQSR